MKSTDKLHSISRRVAASLALMIALVSAILVVFMYFYASRAASTDLERKADETLLYLTGTLELPLWNEDKDTANLIAKTVFQNDLIATLKINDSFGNTFISMTKDAEAGRVERMGEVFHRGMSVGAIKLSLTTRIHSDRTSELLGSFAFAVSLIVVCLMLLTGLIVRTLLRRPLGDLNRIVDAYSAGIYEPSFAPISYLEFQAVGEVLAQMGGKISGQLEQLKTAEQRYRSIFENATEGIFQATMAGQFLNGNPALSGILGYQSSEELLSCVSDIASDLYVDHKQRDKLLSHLLEQVFVNGFEAQLRRKDGRTIWVSISARLVRNDTGAPLFIEGFLSDITDRKLSQQALQDSRQRLDNIVANSPGAIYRCINDSEWTMEFLSAAITRITGYPSDDFLQNRVRSYASIIHPDDRRAVKDAVSDALLRKDRYEIDYRLIASDGSMRWVHEQGQGVFAPDGRLLCLDGVIFDITDQKAAQEEIRKLNQELEHRVVERTAELQAANKELEAFAYSVSHDLRAPLRHIDGFLDLLKARVATALDDKSQHYIDTISNAAKRMGVLIDDLLAFSRMGRAAMATEDVDLGALVKEVILEFEPETEGRDINWQIGALPVVTGDSAMLRMVLVNLISNALKFTQKRTKAEIEIGSLPGSTEETIVFIRDNGAGFDMQYADKLFGVFQRLHSSDEFEGTGIGLANVRRVISRHGGRVWAEGKVNEGATIYFSLPRSGCEEAEHDG